MVQRRVRHSGSKKWRMKAPVAGNMTMQGVVMMLLHSATNAHIQHLQTTSFAEHKALQAYYEGIVGPVDSVVELVQGMKGQIVREYPLANIGFSEEMKPLEYISYVRTMFNDHRSLFPANSHVQNALDVISDLLDSTVYKLRFLH